MHIALTPNVHWVGKIDTELRQFHGSDFSTHRALPIMHM